MFALRIADDDRLTPRQPRLGTSSRITMSTTELEHVKGVWRRMQGNSPIYVSPLFLGAIFSTLFILRVIYSLDIALEQTIYKMLSQLQIQHFQAIKSEILGCRSRYRGQNPFPILESLMTSSRDNVSILPRSSFSSNR